MRIGIASRPDHVMHRTAETVHAVPVERVLDDRRHRPKERQAGPELFARRDMHSMDRPCLAGKEPLLKIAGMPEIEIADLWPFDRADTKEAASRHPKAGRVPRFHQHLAGLAGTGARGPIQVKVGR